MGPFIDVKIRPKVIHWGVNLYQSTDVKVKEEELALGKSLPLTADKEWPEAAFTWHR